MVQQTNGLVITFMLAIPYLHLSQYRCRLVVLSCRVKDVKVEQSQKQMSLRSEASKNESKEI